MIVTVGSEEKVARAKKAGAKNVIVTGGSTPDHADLLVLGSGEEIKIPGERIDSVHTHGTGCTLASALASHLARGDDVPEAMALAKAYVTGAIAAGFPLGSGIGPTDHLWQLRGHLPTSY